MNVFFPIQTILEHVCYYSHDSEYMTHLKTCDDAIKLYITKGLCLLSLGIAE